ncbi:unnamed protein product [Phyllotreta striolata]|uniref:Myb-like domain-containing protein n=1 Tax=Phyllotreta striolata TaxID=444603 RepID=A0A9N9TTL0_PHYSR|nr:unnamed protein product [Phyllotreta striolata]
MASIIEDELESSTSNVIYITEEHRIEWTHEATKELLKLYDEKCDMLDSGIISTQKKLWELVSKDMNKKGYYYTGAQCENKWKTLKRNYRSKMEKMDKYGHKRPCPFENEITEILSKRPQENMFNRSYVSNKLGRYGKRRDDFDYQINLNDPPGFGEERDPIDIKEAKLLPKVEAATEDLIPDTEYIIQDNFGLTQVVEELTQLRKVVVKNNKTNSDILSKSNELNMKIVSYLAGATQRETQTLELEETRMEQQNEIIKQMKIQNSLLQKLLDRLG